MSTSHNMRGICASMCLVVLTLSYQFANASNEPLRIYIDADFTNHAESSVSIERGLTTALNSVDMKIQGRPVDILRMDHRGNSVRSKHNIKKYLSDSQALLLVSGIHSPPLLAHRDFINENEALFLVPWAAAAPITRPPSKDNWIFRLSVDDSKAGEFLMRYVVTDKQYTRPLLLLEATGWGNSNHTNMMRALETLDVEAVDVVRFDWNLGPAQAEHIVSEALHRKNDVVVLVANAVEGAVIVSAVANIQEVQGQLPVVSHWGITGGDFHTKLDHEQRSAVELTFLQTRYSFLHPQQTPFQQSVYESAKALFADINDPVDIVAPTGFVHAHDIMKITLQALSSFQLGSDIRKDRNNLRIALETVKNPVEGLLKTYTAPFSPYAPNLPDSHEALGAEEFVLGQYGSKDQILLPAQ